MRTIHRIGIGFLAGVFFAGGYGLRLQCTHREQLAELAQNRSALTQGTRVASVDLEGASNIDLRPVETLYSVVKNLREHYVEQLTSKDEGKMTHDALTAMLASLNDPNTRFIESDQRKIIADAQESKFHGIGAILGIKRIKAGDINEEHLIVIAPLASGPAEKAGLKPGDDITAVDGKSILPFDPFQRANEFLKDARTKKTEQNVLRKQLEGEQKRIENGTSILDAESKLDSADGKTVELAIARKGSAKEIKIKLQMSEFAVEPVASSMVGDGKYGYIKINDFSEATPQQFAEKISSFKSNGAKGLVLDLRNLAGGQEESVLQTAKYIAPEKILGILQKSHNRRSPVNIPTSPAKDVWSGPVVVLVNDGTAKMPEVLASALKDHGVARLVGEKTYGDFTYTTLIDQADGSAVEMTMGKFLTSRGKDLNGQGVPVDIEVSAANSGDAQLDRAIKLLSGS